MNTKKFIMTLALCLCTCMAEAQKPHFGLEYTGELQANLRGKQKLDDGTEYEPFNFMNNLRLYFDMDFGKHFSVHVASLSIARTSKERIAPDYQWFSNIDEDNLPFTLAVAGVEWKANDAHSLFAGIRNMNVDYFTSDVTSFFTNSSCGAVPTIAFNYDICNFPCASIGLHYRYDVEKFAVQASVYNGRAYTDFGGRENLFRVCPKDDGIYAMTQGEYRHKGSSYFLGGVFHYGDTFDAGKNKARGTFWAYAEQKLTRNMKLLAAYSRAFGKTYMPLEEEEGRYETDAPCTDYAALGLKADIKKFEVGALLTYANYIYGTEWGTEFTGKVTLTRHCSLQPAIHLFKNSDAMGAVGLVRCLVVL